MTAREIVHGLWIGPRLSTMERLSIRSFLQNGHPYHLYVYDPVEGVPAGATIRPADEILPRERIFKYREHDSYAGFANLFAYKVLLEQGGYWADCDMICLQPLDTAAPYVFPAERARDGPFLINNCLMKVPVGCEMMRRAYETAAVKDITRLRWQETGPRLISRLVDDLHLHEYVSPPSIFCPIDFWRWYEAISGKLLRRLAVRLKMARGARGVHLWNEMWRRNNADKDRTYPPQSLYERLKRRYLRDTLIVTRSEGGPRE